jgi:6-phosphogluconolactonase (cycloisomerase 2 family)
VTVPARVVVGGYAESTGAAVLELEPNGGLRLLSVSRDLPDASFLALAPDGRTIFAGLEHGQAPQFPDGALAVLHLDGGELRLVGVHDSGGQQPCHLDVSPEGDRLLVAHYGCGTVSVFEVAADGTVTLADRRPGAPGGRAHAAGWLGPSTALVTDIALDRLRQLDVAADGRADAPDVWVDLPAGSGPRHVVAAGDHVYVVNEYRSTITVLRRADGALRVIGELPALPATVHGAGNYPAALRLAPDRRSLFVTHRGADVLARVPVRPDGSLAPVTAWWRTGGAWPQDVQLSLDGRFAVLAHRRSGDVTAIDLDDPRARRSSVPLPLAASCVLVIPSP